MAVTIYTNQGAARFTTPINKGSKRVYKLMGDDYITLLFSVPCPVYFKLGDYCDIDGFGRYELCQPYQPAYNKGTGGYDYELKLDAQYKKWRNKLMRFLPASGGAEVSFSVTLTPADHLALVMENVKALANSKDDAGNTVINYGYLYNGTQQWNTVASIDASVEQGAKTLSYDSTSILDALGQIAEAYECEWWIQGNTVCLGKCERTNEYVDLEIGGNVAEMTRSDSKETYVTRVLAYGSERNISPRYRKVLYFTVTETDAADGKVRVRDHDRQIRRAWIKDDAQGVTYTDGDGGAEAINGLTLEKLDGDGNVTGTPLNAVRYNPDLKASPQSEVNWFELPAGRSLSVGERFRVVQLNENKVKSSYFTSKYLAWDSYSDVIKYGVVANRLMLPESLGHPYVDYNEGLTQEEGVEDVVVFEDVYPKMVCTVTEVLEVDREETVENDDGSKTVRSFTAYIVKDDFFTSAHPFKDEYIIENGHLQAVFQDGKRWLENDPDIADKPSDTPLGSLRNPQSGRLNGWTFDIGFTRDTDGSALWEINRDDASHVPNEFVRPEAGDQFVLTGFDIQAVDDLYVPAAEEELLKKTREYIAKQNIDPSTYDCTMMPDAVVSPVNPQGLNLELGTRVNLLNEAWLPVTTDSEGRRWGRKSRVIGYEMALDIPWDNPHYTIGEKATYSRLGAIDDKIDEFKFAIAGQTATSGGVAASNARALYVIGQGDPTPPTDSNVFSALRSLVEFPSRRVEESIAKVWRFIKGLTFGNFVKGHTGAAIDGEGDAEFNSAVIRGEAKTDKGYYVGDFQPGAYGGAFWEDDEGKVHLETDYIEARAKIKAKEVEIQEETHVGGCQIISPAAMRCSRVVPIEENGVVTAYKCFFTAKDDRGNVVFNQFRDNDLARCETFNLVRDEQGGWGNRYYWRRVLATGYVKEGDEGYDAAYGEEHYIVLGNAAGDKDASVDNDAPQSDDRIITVGNTADKDRQNLIMTASYGSGSPYIYQYAGIDHFALDKSNLKVAISPNGNMFTGRFIVVNKGEETPLQDYILDNAMQFEIVPSAPMILPDAEGHCNPTELSCAVFLITGNARTAEVPLANDVALTTYAAGQRILFFNGRLLTTAPTEAVIPGEMLLRYKVFMRDGTQAPLRLYTGPIQADADMERIIFHLYRQGVEIGTKTVLCQYDTAAMRTEYTSRFDIDERKIEAEVTARTEGDRELSSLVTLTADGLRSQITEKYDLTKREYTSLISQTARQISLKVDELSGIENLVKTGSGWMKTDTSGALVDLSPDDDGLYTVVNPTVSPMYIRTPGFVLLDNATYTLSFKWRSSDGDMAVQTQVIGDSNVVIGRFTPTTDLSANVWKSASFTFDAPAVSPSCAFVRFINAGATLSGAVTLDIKEVMLEAGDTAHDYIEDKTGLLATGIDIANKEIKFTADKFFFINNHGERSLVIDEEGHILAKYINADALDVKRLSTGEPGTRRVTVTPEEDIQIYDADGQRVASFEGKTYNNLAGVFDSAATPPRFIVTLDGCNLTLNPPGTVIGGPQTAYVTTQQYLTYEADAVHTTTGAQFQFTCGHVAMSLLSARQQVVGGFQTNAHAEATVSLCIDTWPTSDTSGSPATRTVICSETVNADDGGGSTYDDDFFGTAVVGAGYHRLVAVLTASLNATGAQASATFTQYDDTAVVTHLEFYRAVYFGNGLVVGTRDTNALTAYNDADGKMHLSMMSDGYGLKIEPTGITYYTPSSPTGRVLS